MDRHRMVVTALGALAIAAPLWSCVDVGGGKRAMAATGPERATPTSPFLTQLASPDLEPVRSPERVESLPVENLVPPEDESIAPMATNLPGRFRILEEPVPVPPQVAAELSRLVLAQASYLDDYQLCIFEPGIAFRFWKGKKAVDVLVCFHCTDLAFQVVGAPKAVGPKLAFEPIRGDLVRLAQRARPGDRRFEGLLPKPPPH